MEKLNDAPSFGTVRVNEGRNYSILSYPRNYLVFELEGFKFACPYTYLFDTTYSHLAAWLGAELSALTGGLATLAMLGLVAAAFPSIRRYRITR